MWFAKSVSSDSFKSFLLLFNLRLLIIHFPATHNSGSTDRGRLLRGLAREKASSRSGEVTSEAKSEGLCSAVHQQPPHPAPRPTKKRPTLCSVGRNFYATLQITCTGRPAWSDARNGHRRQPGSSRTEPWRDPGRRGPDGCNESRWPGSPDTWTYRRPWRSG